MFSSLFRKEEEEKKKPTLHEVVEKIGCGPTHARYAFTAGGVYVADGSELLLCSAITEALTQDWGLSPMERGLLVTIVYFGMLIGNFSSGPIGDNFGRKVCILGSYLIVFAFSWASSLSATYAELSILRFIAGFGIGIGIPALNAMGVELVPNNRRMAFQCVAQSLFPVGECYCAVMIMLDDPTMLHLHWRPLVRQAAMPAVVFLFLSLMLLYESPSYLAQQGHEEEAKLVLSSNARDNGFEDMDVAFRVIKADKAMDSDEMGSRLRLLFSNYLLPTTLVCLFSALMCNFMFYGILYAMTQILPELEGDAGSASMQLLYGALWEFPGAVLGGVLAPYVRRKLLMKIGAVLAAVCVITFQVGTLLSAGWLATTMYYIGYYGSKCTAMTYFCATYLFAAEVYPTSLRATGNGLCVAFARLGAMVAPVLYEGLQVATGSHGMFFYIMGVLLVINALVIDFVPFEPSLIATMDTFDEAKKLVSDQTTSYD